MSATAARALFESAFGRPSEALFSAPGRANLIGEHTDYNDGYVLPFAIPSRTFAAVGVRPDERIRVTSTFSPEPVEVALSELADLFPSEGTPRVPEWAAYPLGVAWALRERFPDAVTPGLDIAFASEVPVGAGLSSSAAIEGAAASAMNALWALGADATTLALAGRRAENEAVGAPTGIMDQMAVMHGHPDAATFLDCRTLEVAAIPVGFVDADLELLVIDTRTTHAHSTGGYRERRASCELGAAEMGVPALRDLTVADLARAEERFDDVTFRRVRHIVTENQRVLDTVATLRSAGPTAIGDLLVASHVSMRDDFEISTIELDTAVESALAAGALGARMTGGGFGGAAVALVRVADAEAVEAAVRATFAERGFREPNVFAIWPADGAHRDA
ncbi:galactokinase [Microbacterium gorillae]|uniref:galactokinase n=1 Tax=Microbacterium gorillae TaxID=1231063 RepID=UPI000694539C|nr:galactokinase [Microbacterium gorillae]